MDPAGNKEDFNFETLNASVQASIDAKKQENAQALSAIRHSLYRCVITVVFPSDPDSPTL